MKDYFFISSPLHLLMSGCISIQSPAEEKIAIMIAKNPAARIRLQEIAGRDPDIFNRVLCIPPTGAASRREIRTSVFRILRDEFDKPMQARILTGNDRRIEFQYAMHIARRAGSQVDGVYVDEGAVTYSGHKSMYSIQHRYIDPFFKKLFYGFWYSNALTTGASSWIHTVYAAFPEAVHPLLTCKHVIPIDVSPFKAQPMKALASAMLDGHPDYPGILGGIKAVYTLPHEGAYAGCPDVYRAIGRQLCQYFKPSEIAIKPHPRITRPDLPVRMFPGAVLLDHRIGMEAILPLLGDGCVVVGDISSTLLTTRWLRPDLTVLALVPGQGAVGGMEDLYRRLGIPMVQGRQLGELLSCDRKTALTGGSAAKGR